LEIFDAARSLAARDLSGNWCGSSRGDVRHEITAVDPGILYRSGQLTAEELKREIHERGIKTVINLGSRTDWDTEVCATEGVDYIDLPVGDVWSLCGVAAPGYPKPSAPYDVTPFWQAIDDPAKQPVLIHCWGGIHRTGVLSGIYRIERQGWSADDALAEMRLFGFNNNKEKFSEVLDYMHQLEQQVHERTAEKSSPSEQSDASRR
jgi:protein-tyrosine phosphatase